MKNLHRNFFIKKNCFCVKIAKRNRNMDQGDYIFKIIIIGDSGTGKSSFIYYFLNAQGIFHSKNYPKRKKIPNTQSELNIHQK